MRLAYALLYLVQWVFFVIWWVLSVAYSVVQFVSKPGSRLIVPTVTAVALFYRHEALYPLVQDFLSAIDFQVAPEPWLLDSVLGIGFVLAACGYVLLSHVLAVVLGTFPPITRPLAPMRRLRVTRRPIRPVVVRQVVPRLRRRWL